MAQDMNEATRVMGAGGAPGAPGVPTDDRTMVAGGGADRTMVAGMAPPAGVTQMGQTVACPVCRTSNSTLETYCGFLLASAPGAADEAPADDSPVVELVENSSGRRFRLKPGVNTVGREACDILLMDSTVSRRHAQVSVEGGAVAVTDLGSTNGTHVDGGRIAANQPVTLAPGAALKFGNVALTLPGASGAPAEATVIAGTVPADATVVLDAAPPVMDDATLLGGAATAPAADAAPAAGPPVSARLRPASPNAEEVEIRPGVITLGRRAGNDVVLNGDPYVSGQHARITCDEVGCTLTDVGSTNGTTVNGQRLAANAPQLLADGDEVSFGQTSFKFERSTPAPAGTATAESLDDDGPEVVPYEWETENGAETDGSRGATL
jgi:pSer/pThr/pTyr-binding forkhead associated (FHA) protein